MTNCPECNEQETIPWCEQPMNEEIRESARSYISPVKMFHKDLEEALSVWGENFDD